MRIPRHESRHARDSLTVGRAHHVPISAGQRTDPACGRQSVCAKEANNLHAELLACVATGMRPYEALRTVTVNPARALAWTRGVSSR